MKRSGTILCGIVPDFFVPGLQGGCGGRLYEAGRAADGGGTGAVVGRPGIMYLFYPYLCELPRKQEAAERDRHRSGDRPAFRRGPMLF